MKRYALILFAVSLVMIMSACGRDGADASSAPEILPPGPSATAEPAPEPTPEPVYAPVELTLSDESAEEILALAQYDSLKKVDGRLSHEYTAMVQLSGLLPDCSVIYEYEFEGNRYPNTVEGLTAQSTEGLTEALECLPAVRTVDLTGCEVSSDLIDELETRFPDVEFVWMVSFLNWTVRSDITCFSTLLAKNSSSPRYPSEAYEPLLKYCRHLKALDLGHNALTDISLIGNLSELQVLILADNERITDISPLGNLKNLQYLELFSCTAIQDFSVLSELNAMVDINLSNLPKLKSLDFLDDMPELKTCWLKSYRIPVEDIRAAIEQYPDIQFCYWCSSDSLTCCGWRATDRNVAIRQAFWNWPQVVSFNSWDDVKYIEGAELKVAIPDYEHR